MIRICQTRAAKRSRRTLAAFRAPSAGMAGQGASFPMFASIKAAGAFLKDRAQTMALYLATLEVKSARFSIAGRTALWEPCRRRNMRHSNMKNGPNQWAGPAPSLLTLGVVRILGVSPSFPYSDRHEEDKMDESYVAWKRREKAGSQERSRGGNGKSVSSSNQPGDSWHPRPQEYRSRPPSRGREFFPEYVLALEIVFS